jgi:hypothetical protein
MKKLSLHRETLRTLTSRDARQARGGNPLTFTITLSVEYCGSRNGCATLDGDCNGTYIFCVPSDACTTEEER